MLTNIARIARVLAKIEICKERSRICWELAIANARSDEERRLLARALKGCDWHFDRARRGFVAELVAAGGLEGGQEHLAAIASERERAADGKS